MHIITVDFETHYSTDYSLSKLSPLEYVRDARFQIISASIRYPNGQCTTCFGEHDVRQALAQVDWGCSAFLAHNGSGFDAYVAAYHFGINPRLWMCTLAMARPIFAKTVGLSLGKLVEHFGIGVKDNTALVQTRGKRLEDFTAAERAAMAAYNQADTEQCWALFGKLRPYYNIAELWQIDTMVRMRTEPQFVVDQAMLEVALSIERGNKQKDILHLAKLLGATREGSTEDIEERVRQHLASAPKFSALLQQLGEPVPMKPSPTNPDKQVPALAKTDQAFTDLLESSNPVVAAAARARLTVKSTLLETRIGKFLTAARLADGRLPVPLRYCGADTTGRPSGEEYNCLNLPRVSPDKPKVTDALRNSLMAPPGKAVMVADSSGIEMRVNHFLWQVPYSTALWTADPEADLYRASAAIKYNIRPEDVSKAQRQGAKVELLALGYGMGAAKYVDTARLMGGITLSPEQAQTDVYDWRNRHGPIVAGWKMLDKALTWIARGKRVALDPGGLIHTHPEGLLLPSGRLIRYPDLRQETDEATGKAQWAYAHGRHKAYLYGGKSVENLCVSGAAKVLTQRGWVQLADVLAHDLIHDGVEFVRHDGLINKGVKACVQVDGVAMTPDHEVLTNGGWTQAGLLTTTDAQERLVRPAIRDADSHQAAQHNRQKVEVAVGMRLRGGVCQSRSRPYEGSAPRRHPQLRMCDGDTTGSQECTARHVSPPRLRGLALIARPMQQAVAPRLEKLWRSGHRRLQQMARVVRELLGGHGRLVLPWPRSGQNRQRRAVLPGQLPLDHTTGQHHEQAQHPARSGHLRACAKDGHQPINHPVPPGPQLAAGQDHDTPFAKEQVFDLINCGPRRRFVVMGQGGPFIVHNCQALARDIMSDYMLEFYRRTGLRPCLYVYDELVYVVDQDRAPELLNTLQTIMRTPPKWWPQLRTWSEGDIAQRYGHAK